MHFKHFEWTVEKLNALRNDIDPKPQYQRGDAWDDFKRSLLIDSILTTYDIPKIYLRHSVNISTFDYEVADGQQRLKAIWRFLDDDLVLQGMSAQYSHLNGKTFSSLKDAEKRHILQFEFITTVIYGATTDQIRELFRRLQIGVRLNPAELRNSMASSLGDEIRAMAITHPFFKKSAFATARYKADDLLAHAFAILIYKRQRDIKAPDLKAMYVEHANKIDPAFAEHVNAILHFLNRMQRCSPRCIRTKWGFVDLVGVLATRNLDKLDPRKIAKAYVDWEEERANKLARLRELAAAGPGTRDRMLFDYISAFQKEGATRKHLETRFLILDSIIP